MIGEPFAARSPGSTLAASLQTPKTREILGGESLGKSRGFQMPTKPRSQPRAPLPPPIRKDFCRLTPGQEGIGAPP